MSSSVHAQGEDVCHSLLLLAKVDTFCVRTSGFRVAKQPWKEAWFHEEWGIQKLGNDWCIEERWHADKGINGSKPSWGRSLSSTKPAWELDLPYFSTTLDCGGCNSGPESSCHLETFATWKCKFQHSNYDPLLEGCCFSPIQTWNLNPRSLFLAPSHLVGELQPPDLCQKSLWKSMKIPLVSYDILMLVILD